MSAGGQVLRADLTGEIRLRPELSGMPELSLGLNDRAHFESHLCIMDPSSIDYELLSLNICCFSSLLSLLIH